MNSFGVLLKQWRSLRGLSQLALSLEAGISARHLSFIETGRANPSRHMVVLLAESLNLPLRESNHLLEAAGFARGYPDQGLGQPDPMARSAFNLILANQEPFPAVVMDRHWNLLEANPAAQRFFTHLLPQPPAHLAGNILRMMFHPEGLRPYVLDWPRVAHLLLGRTRREAVGGVLDPGLRALLEEVLSYSGVKSKLAAVGPDPAPAPVAAISFRKDSLAADFFSTVTTLGTPQDVALQEMRIECFFPANQQTRESPFFSGPARWSDLPAQPGV